MNTKFCQLKGQQKSFYFITNSASSCCRAHPVSLKEHSLDSLNSLWLAERELLSQGVELPGCSICWRDEKLGKQSYRNISNSYKNQIENIIISVDNTCNQMCSYCSPKFSSEWERNIRANGQFDKISKTSLINLELVNSNVDNQWIERLIQYIKNLPDRSLRLNLIGGEPLMQLSNLKLLLDVSMSKTESIIITTNLNPPSPKFLHWILDNCAHEKLNFAISIDSTPEFNHIPRGRFNPSKFNSNLNLLKQLEIKYYFMSTISVLGALNMPAFMQWVGDTKIEYNYLNNPLCLSAGLLPRWAKDEILKTSDTLPKSLTDIFNKDPEPTKFQLYEQLMYLTQYFQRVEIDTLTVDHSLFQRWWLWLQSQKK